MRSRTKMHVLRSLGGVVAALAVVPWLGVGAASASSQADGNCSTRPSGVGAGATCTLLKGPNGTTVFGETWVMRTQDNLLDVKTYPYTAPESSDAVSLCVSTSAYPAKHQCNAGDADNVYTGRGTSLTVTLGNFSISPSSPVFFSLSVIQGSTSAVSNGNGGSSASPSPSPTATKTTSSPSPTATETTGSPSPTATETTGSPSPTTTETTGSPSPTTTETTGSPSPTTTETTGSPSPTTTETTGSPSPTTTATTGSPSPSVSETKTTSGPSVLPTRIHRTDGTPSPSASVLAVKLAHTGADGTVSTLAVSVGLLALGGILVAAGQSNRAKRRH